MKRKYIGLVTAILLICISCRKPQDQDCFPAYPLFGVWQWTHSTGGFSTHTVTTTANTIVTLKFYGGLTYELQVNGQITAQGKYSLLSNANYTVIQFDKPVSGDKLYLQTSELIDKLESGQLTLYDNNISEGFAHYFDKLK